MIVLDTNVISELMRPQPEPRVLAWANGLDPEAVAITAMNEAEILHGLARLPDGRRKQQLQQSWDALAAKQLWRRKRLARPMATADAVIAATALARRVPLATSIPGTCPELGKRSRTARRGTSSAMALPRQVMTNPTDAEKAAIGTTRPRTVRFDVRVRTIP